MKKALICTAVFAMIFVLSYLFLSTFVIGWKLKLSAPPEIYFIENLKQLWHIKSAISAAIGIIAGGATLYLCRKNRGEI